MATIKLGAGIIDIKGGFSGIYFHRDKSGLHACSKPRKVKQRTPAQITQRNAFTTARNFSKDERTVSYNIYRALNGLDMQEPPIEFSISKLRPAGK